MRRLFALFLIATFPLSARADSSETPPKKPALLFCTDRGHANQIDFDYLARLAGQGFTVDYLDHWRDLNWQRVAGYNVLVFFRLPFQTEGGLANANAPAWEPGYRETVALINRFLASRGGVMFAVHRAGASPADYAAYTEMLAQFGAKLPMERIKAPPANVLPHPRLRGMPFMFTDNILPSPVSEGVEGIWWPNPQMGRGHNYIRYSGPIDVDDSWQVVVRGAAGSQTYAHVPSGIDQFAKRDLIANPHRRTGGVAEPALFAVSQRDAGRVALFHCLKPFHIGSGTKWLHNGAMLDKGLGHKPSDFGRLLSNTFRWLANPSLQREGLGGATVAEDRLLPPPLKRKEERLAIDPSQPWRVEIDPDAPPTSLPLFRGLVGAQTAYSGATGSVADYATAARKAKLDFVIFLEDFSQLSAHELQQLRDDCEAASDEKLLLLPGYRMQSNLGNRMLFYGREPVYPLDYVMSHRKPGTYCLQGENDQGQYTFRHNEALDFMIKQFMGRSNVRHNNLGFYDFRRAQTGGGVALYHCRLFGCAAVMFYENGELVEDVTDQYLRTNAGTMPCVPLAVERIGSPEALLAAVNEGHALTYVTAHSLPRIIEHGLRKNHQLDSLPVSVSSGPLIRSWPKSRAANVYGNERFVNFLSVFDGQLHVTSPVGLKEVNLYDGQRLFRRFLPRGAKELHVRLYLSALMQRNLSVVAYDVDGGKAVSFPARTWKHGTPHHVLFCGDHVNHCTGLNMKMARGPLSWPIYSIPDVPAAGTTWDGGPTAIQPILGLNRAAVSILTDQGDAQNAAPYQYPDLIFADEAAYRGRSVITGLCEAGGNAWSGWGPHVEMPLADGESILTEFSQYVDGVDPTAWGDPGLGGGNMTSIYEQQLVFKKDLTVTRLSVTHNWRQAVEGLRALLLTGRGTQLDTAHDVTPTGYESARSDIRIDTGAWFAALAEQGGNCVLCFNRGAPLRLSTSGRSARLAVDLPPGGMAVKAGQKHEVELATLAWPLSQAIPNSVALLQIIGYLENPYEMEVRQGTRSDDPSPGILTFEADAGVAEVFLPRPPNRGPQAVPEISLPIRLTGLNRRWSAGVFQIEGFNGKQYFSDGRKVYRPLGIDRSGRAYLPAYPHKARRTHLVFGHPVVADERGEDLFIQVTALTGPFKNGNRQPKWHVSVNNPTDQPVTTLLKRRIALPGMQFDEVEISLKPGEYRVLEHVGVGLPRPDASHP